MADEVKSRVPCPLSSIHRRSRVSFEVKSEDPRSPSANPSAAWTREPCSLFFRCGIRVSRLARGSYLTNQTTFSYGTKISSLRAFLPFFPFFFLSPLIPFHVLSFVPSRTFSYFSFLLSTRCSIFLSLDFSEKLQRISSKICNII